MSFGLVNVPVKAYAAVSQKDVRFHQLHAEDGGRVRYRKVCEIDGKELSREEIVKGFEVGGDRWVTVTEEELDAADPEATKAVQIETFVDLADVDPVHFELPYWLMPDKGAGKAYGLLVRAMEGTGKVAIGRVVMRTKEYLVAVRAKDGVLVMSTMAFPDEVVDPSSIAPAEVKGGTPSDKEVAMAEQLVEALSGPWEPERFRDEHREKVLALLERKAAGETIEVPAVEAPKKTTDLMAALEASLKAAKRKETHAAAEA